MSEPNEQAGAPTDPIAILASLDADAIEAKLTEMDRDREALLVLLRAARRQQKRSKKPTTEGKP